MIKTAPIVCPFCPLHCDDLIVDDQSNVNVECSIAVNGFRNALDPSVRARTGGDHVWGDVIRVSTAGASLSLSRTLAEQLRNGRIELSIDESPTRSATRAAIARDGIISATLGDVRKHADVIWVLGNPESELPRLWERLKQTDNASPRVVRSQSETVTANELADIAYTLKGGSTDRVAGVEEIASAKYFAIIIGPDAFAVGQELAAAEMLIKLVLDLNLGDGDSSRRAVLVSIDPAATLRALVAWQSNDVLPTTSAPIDVRIGNPIANSPAAKIQWGGTDPGNDLADSFFPAIVAGVHHSDAIIRGDSTVTLPLSMIAPATLGRVALEDVLPTNQSGSPSKAGAKSTK